MILMKILPGVLKELAKHVPTVLFQTVEWGELAQELPKISRRMIQKEGFAELYDHHAKRLHPYHINLTAAPIHPAPLQGDKEFGEKLLVLYFSQLLTSEGLFLDLRSQHFERKGSILKWHPSAFWTKLDENFRQGLLKVYDGFYLGKDNLYFEGLKDIGLMNDDWSEEDKKNLGELFKTQFGDAHVSEVAFSLDHLNHSIVKLSDFMLKRKMKIPKDFLYLGIYLVGLYSTLEEVQVPLPVKDIYLNIRHS